MKTHATNGNENASGKSGVNQLEQYVRIGWHRFARRIDSMKIVRILVLVIFAIIVALPLGISKPEYSKKENKACTFCHPPGKMKELTPAGQYYKDHNHSLEGYKAS